MANKSKIRWDEAGTAGENARAQLPAVAGGYFRAGRKLMSAARRPEELHAFRLKTKRLRYTLELFRTCYGPPLERRLQELRDLQTILGDINDCEAALKIATKSLSARSADSRKLKQYLDARSKKLVAAFRKHWQQKFDAPGKEDWWTSGLAR